MEKAKGGKPYQEPYRSDEATGKTLGGHEEFEDGRSQIIRPTIARRLRSRQNFAVVALSNVLIGALGW